MKGAAGRIGTVSRATSTHSQVQGEVSTRDLI